MDYQRDVLYTAYVDTRKDVHRIYFMLHYDKDRDAKTIFIKKDLKDRWNSYVISMPDTIQYACPWGICRVNFHLYCSPTWMFYIDGANYEPTVSVMGDDDYKGKHYDAIIDDDVVDAAVYFLESERVKKMEKSKGLPLTPLFKNVAEGGEEMKALYHVILFNRKTEEIDFKAYISAAGEIEAGMTAAHNYDKYDGKIHMHIVKHISSYEAIK